MRLGNLVKWLGEQAEAAGIEVHRLRRAEILYDESGAVKASPPATWALNRDGTPARTTRRAWSCTLHNAVRRGLSRHPGKQLEAKYKLREGVDPQTYGIGMASCG